jgi:hypothetical protein
MVIVVKGGGRAPSTLTSQAKFTLMKECTAESGRYHSVYSVVGGARPPSFITFTITSKVAVYAPTEWADTLTLFHLLFRYVLCGWDH